MSRPALRGSIAALAPGWAVAFCLLWLCWATLAPVVADAARPMPSAVVCPMPIQRDLVRCPPPHQVTTSKVSCLFVLRIDLCSNP